MSGIPIRKGRGQPALLSAEGAAAGQGSFPLGALPLSATRLNLLVARIPLLAYLLGAVGVASVLSAITSRGTFFDEGIYLMAGRTLVFRGENWINATYESWFMGSPFLFPVLAGVVQWLGGDIVAVRIVNVGFLLIAVWGTYQVIMALRFGRTAALLGTASFGLSGTAIYTGSFATYDMPAMASLILALWLALAGTADRRIRVLPLLGAGALIGLATLTKYVAITLIPVLIALVAVRLLMPSTRDSLNLRMWRTALAAAGLVAAPVALIVGTYLYIFWDAMNALWGLQGGHLTPYGATAPAILWALLWYTGPAWLLASFGLEQIRRERGPFMVCLVLLAASLIMPAYHMWKIDPLAIFKQVNWSLALISPMVGVTLATLLGRPKTFAVVATALLVLSVYHVVTLQRFYPDTRPAAEWLAERVDASTDPILVDDAYPYRAALADTFDGREWWVVDQWWWFTTLGTPELWQSLIRQGTFSYIVLERGSAFNGKGSIFDNSVIETLEHSGRYRLVATFPSYVTWGNSVLPPPFRGQLSSYSTVNTEVWARED